MHNPGMWPNARYSFVEAIWSAVWPIWQGGRLSAIRVRCLYPRSGE